ncbi:hypothetical protein FH965_26305 [Streptomyces spectabilis]|uniref:Uncharacterized protein n=1 Tax=Streptomyces spectabilis TaxID=68270 RepID=A0A516RD96_STRST|nr:hypothetical protein FH965_26305 [Streptomyces spectabilis]
MRKVKTYFFAGSRKPEAGSRKPEAGSRKPEAGSRKPDAARHRNLVPRSAEDRGLPFGRPAATPDAAGPSAKRHGLS